MKNDIGRDIPEYIEGLGKIQLFEKNFTKNTKKLKERQDCSEFNKVVPSLERAIQEAELKDGMTISFHHHFRNGDYIVNMVVDAIAKLGLKDIVVASSSLSEVHAPLIHHIKNGVIRRIETSGLRGDLAEAISDGLMDIPIRLRSHGGRARAIVSGELHIDVAFLGVPSCDVYGNANGYTRDESATSACGSLGYAKVDAQYADKVVLITDNIVGFPNVPFAIPQLQVNYIVKVDSIGDPNGIMSGATRFTKNPKDLLIAKNAADVIFASGYFEDGFSFQTGSGGAALATTRFLTHKMDELNIKASFALGGITGQIVKMYEEGYVKKLLDVQSFDLGAVQSLISNRYHYQIDASYYANPNNRGSAVNQLDIVILSALEIDLDFNINVITGSDGVIRGAIGGHPDTAAGSSVSIIVAPLTRGRIPTILDKVNTVVTPGHTVDVLVTDQGIAVNPLRQDLLYNLKEAKLPVYTIEELKEKAEKVVGKPDPVKYEDKIVGLVNYRDGKVIDVIRQVAKER